MDKKVFSSNLKLLGEKNPKLALKMQIESQAIVEGKGDFCFEENKEVEFLLLYDIQKFSLRFLNDFLQKNEKVKLLAISAQPKDLLSLFYQNEFSFLLKNERFFLYEEEVQEIARKVFLSAHEIVSFEKSEAFLSFESTLFSLVDKMHLCFADFQDYGVKVFKNLLQNLSCLEGSFLFNQLKEKFSSIPAIICGSGSSIESQKELLQKYQGKAIFFVGGSTLSYFSAENIPYQIAAAIDPNSTKERDLFFTPTHTPFIFKLRSNLDGFDCFYGKKLLASCSYGYPLEEALYGFLGDVVLEEENGWNVGNVLADHAAKLGCSPIILVGMDLGEISGKEYPKKMKGAKEESRNTILALSRKKQPMQTRKDCLAACDFFSSLPGKFPAISFLNATEDGLEIPNYPYKNLEEIFLETSLSYDIEGIIHSALALVEPLSFDKKEYIEKLKESMFASESLLNEILECLDKKKRGPLALYETELEEEMVYQTILSPVFRVWKLALENRGFLKEKEKEKEFLFLFEVLQNYKTALLDVCEKL